MKFVTVGEGTKEKSVVTVKMDFTKIQKLKCVWVSLVLTNLLIIALDQSYLLCTAGLI